MVFDESGSGSLAVDGETMACVLCGCIFVCRANERDNEFLDRVEQLCLLVTASCLSTAFGVVRTSLTSSALCNGFSSAGLEGKDVMMIAKNIQWLYSDKERGHLRFLYMFPLQRMTPQKM
jgi:hypothetical protein